MPVIDATESTFQRDVLDKSFEVPVVVDFWAEWCGPCRSLGPVLERLADEADGSWLLAKVDVDTNPRLAAAAGVQGIPAVRAFRDGREVAEFTGALPESQVRAWLQGLGPSEAELIIKRARAAEAAGDASSAAELFREVLTSEPANGEARSGLARVELALRARDADEDALRARVFADPGDVVATTGLADVLFERGEVDEAFAALLEAVRRTTGDGRDRARLHLLSLIDALPAGDKRAASARRALSLAIF